MTGKADLVLRNVELDGVLCDVAIKDGLIHQTGTALTAIESIDAKGGALIPGLIDHHIHLFATAARSASEDLSDASSRTAFLSRLADAARARSPSTWIRAIGYDDTTIGLLTRADLDFITNPVRIQDRTGALWVLNSAALSIVLHQTPPPECVEIDARGQPTGRIWRGDAWLRSRLASAPPSLRPLSATLASFGIVAVTDASASNTENEARLFESARRSGAFSQKLCLMSAGDIPASPYYQIGALKILQDEHNLPLLEDLIAKMHTARQLGRPIAIHCVTAAELALALASFEAVSSSVDDRIEHGGEIPEGMIGAIASLHLTVVTQPSFIFDRGDRYLSTLEPHEISGLYRLASLKRGGVPLAAGSDSPYGGADPWRAMKAATDRRTKSGHQIGASEAISARDALALYLGSPRAPARTSRRIATGEPADLCLLKKPLTQVLGDPHADFVAATMIDGRIEYAAAEFS